MVFVHIQTSSTSWFLKITAKESCAFLSCLVSYIFSLLLTDFSPTFIFFYFLFFFFIIISFFNLTPVRLLAYTAWLQMGILFIKNKNYQFFQILKSSKFPLILWLNYIPLSLSFIFYKSYEFLLPVLLFIINILISQWKFLKVNSTSGCFFRWVLKTTKLYFLLTRLRGKGRGLVITPISTLCTDMNAGIVKKPCCSWHWNDVMEL